jgi:hypothetical protein
MSGSVNAVPEFFAQPLKIKDRQSFRSLSGLSEDMNNLLSDGAMLLVGARLDFSVELVRHILDV